MLQKFNKEFDLVRDKVVDVGQMELVEEISPSNKSPVREPEMQ